MKTRIALLAFLLIGFATVQAQLPQTQFMVDCFDFPAKAYVDEFGDLNVTAKLKSEIKDYKLTVYNNWDEVVFESTNPDEYWDAGNYPDLTNFIWRISGTHSEIATPEFFEITGNVFLLK